MPNPVSPQQTLLYGLPALMVGYMFMLLGIYVLKYATDVLLIAPAVMGTIFGLARIWDAFTDPVVGFLSDRTRSRLGRRRVWMVWSVFPVAAFYIMLYATPVGLSPALSALWMGIAVFGFYTAMTAISVPHLSLGTEAAPDSYSRNKLFGMRHASVGIGAIIGLLTLSHLTGIDQTDTQALRKASLNWAITASGVSIVLVLVTSFLFREPKNSSVRSAHSNVYDSTRDILGNRHARLLLIVLFIEMIGGGALSAAALYVAQYVMNNIEIAPVSIISYLVMSTVSIPVWVRISKHVPKVTLWISTMIGSALSYGGLFFLVFIENPMAQTVTLLVLSVVSGSMSGCAHTLAPSVLSDIIDDDDLRTGTRKEGAYFALYNLSQKSAQGVTVMITGLILSAVSFVPNVEQTFSVKVALCGILGLMPFVCYGVGAALFTRFSLRESEHNEILKQLERRNSTKGMVS